MPGEVIDRPNPPPLPSRLPDDILKLAVKPEQKPLDEDVAKSLVNFQNAACYIAAGEQPLSNCLYPTNISKQ